MPKTYIAFVECTFYDNPPWRNSRENADPESDEADADSRECYIAEDNGAKLSLVDLLGKRRNYTFNKYGVVEIVGNVAIIVEWHLKEPPMDEYQ
ncbi:MAG: hypothetical protein FJ356_05700 [Thaumarchaeota archaeon]|nr:hypothetical protein [Nitrososphaerota archaeon]